MFDQSTSRVLSVVETPLAEQGVEVVDVERVADQVRVTVDSAGGIDLERLTEATRTIKALLADNGLLADSDSLEVSSPGIERPLRTPEHFVKAVGAKVAARLRAGVDGERRLEGTLESADESGVVIDGRHVTHADIERARTVFEWPLTSRPQPKATRPKATQPKATRPKATQPKATQPKATRKKVAAR